MELCALSVADLENRTAMHYHAQQTQFTKGEESLRAYYAKVICAQVAELQKITKTLAVDAFFSKKPFVDSMCGVDFTLVSRMQNNAYLRYAYTGEQKGGKGRPKQFAGRVDVKNLNLAHFKEVKREGDEAVYEGVAHIRSLGRWCKVVILQILKDEKVAKAFIYFSTDPKMDGPKVLEIYKNRYQIEFVFRDAKGHLGLEDCQSRQEKALDFHFNASLTTLNVAKAAHWFSIPKEEKGAFSMADIKTQYINELVLDRLISIYGKDPSVEKNNPAIRDLYTLGRIAA